MKAIGATLAFVVLLLYWSSKANAANVEHYEQELAPEIQEQTPPGEDVTKVSDGAARQQTQDVVLPRPSRRRTDTLASRRRHAGKKTSMARLTTMLLLSAVLAVYGATRWLQAEEVNREARAAAAARREELQQSFTAYEQKMQDSVELTKQLAERKAEAARQQAELQAAAKEVEQAERELVEQLTQQAKAGGDLGSIVGAVVKEAESLEEETRALKEKLKAVSALEVTRGAGEDSLVLQAYEEQRQLAVKKRQVLEKMAARALEEARWGDVLKVEGGHILEAIENTMREIQELNLKKMQLAKDSLASSMLALSVEGKQEAKDALEQEVKALKSKLEARLAANALQEEELKHQQEALEEHRLELELLKAQVEEAKAAKGRLAEEFEAKRQVFMEALAPLEERIAAKEKDPSCVKGVCKITEDKVARKKEEMIREKLVCEALKEHERLEERKRQLAIEAAAPQQTAWQQEVAELEEQLAGGNLSSQAAAILQQRVALLKEDIDKAVENVLEEATKADKDLFLLLEARIVISHNSALGVVNYFDQRVDDDPDNPEVVQLFLRAQWRYEQERLALMRVYDYSVALEKEKSMGLEIHRLYKEGKSVPAVMEEAKKELEAEIAEVEKRYHVTKRRHEHARRGLLFVRNAGEDATEAADPTGAMPVVLKRRLMYERTLMLFYKAKLTRLQSELREFQLKYPDKLAAAKETWRKIKTEYTTSNAQWHAASASKQARAVVSSALESLVGLEDYVEWSEEDDDAEAALAGHPDSPNISDEELLNIVEPPGMSFSAFVEASQAGLEAPATAPDSATPVPEELETEAAASSEPAPHGDDAASPDTR